jgi:hypothetical protein
MAIIAGAIARVQPSHVLPGLLMQYTQRSAAWELIANGAPLPQLDEGDLFVYATRVDVRTVVAGGQHAYNSLPSAAITLQQMGTPTYLARTRAEYDHHDTAAAAAWGVPIVEAHRLAMRQGIAQQGRNALLYGWNPTKGEGLLNAANAVSTTLTADSNGNTTVMTYDNGQMGLFLLNIIAQALARTLQLGQPTRIAIVAPQRVLAQFSLVGIVQLTQFQRPGGGTATTAMLIQDVLQNSGYQVQWGFDDTLVGKGANGSDAVLIVIPEVRSQDDGGMGAWNTNQFAGLAPNLNACTAQFSDMAAPREIPTPLPGGAIDILSELRMTSGWALRPEAVTIVSMVYM